MGNLSQPSTPVVAPHRWPAPFLGVLLASATAWAVIFIAVPPGRQDFPLMDDWAFGRGALLLASGQGIHYSNWASMPQLGQWLWACPFIWLLGPTHVALRLSTIVLTWIGLWAVYDLLRQEKWSANRAALAVATLAFNPLFFLLQGTFMTDIPALALALTALALYARALTRQSRAWLVGGFLVALLAVITRQNTAAVAVVVGLLLWRERPLRVRPLWWAFVGTPAVVAIAVHLWFQNRPDIITVEPRLLTPRSMLLLPFVVIHLCGLATLPLLVLAPRAGSRRAFLVLVGVLVACAGYWLYHGQTLSALDGLFPYTGSFLTPWGVGLGGMNVGEPPIVLTWGVRWFLSLLGCLGGALFVLRIAEWRRRRRPLSPALLFSACQLPFVLIAPALWDRYLLPLIAPGALVLAGAELDEAQVEARPTWRLFAGLSLVGLLALASVGLMHNWLAWNAARWELGRRALARPIEPLDLEGGMEWDGWHVAPRQPPQRRSWREINGLEIVRKSGGPKRLTLKTTRLWFPQVTGRFALSFVPRPDATVLDSEPFHLWLVPGAYRFYLLQYNGDASRPNGQPSVEGLPGADSTGEP
jgi:4-amino-4-deoxy-L-arabinose transferase-like glycosyltransferase